MKQLKMCMLTRECPTKCSFCPAGHANNEIWREINSYQFTPLTSPNKTKRMALIWYLITKKITNFTKQKEKSDWNNVEVE